uniref:F-box domain-containing protein n=1 Tax=Tanacetum cinerariifolium TaxID=118510 RepID=A0A6L2P339_TANCI|nr:hypothetical protein [Tanacetum cinerariifolium]
MGTTLASFFELSLEVVTDDDGRSSGNHITDNKLPSSVHAVVSDDDLLIEILLRLPVLSHLFFKSVSKHWLSLIKRINSTLHWTQNPNLNPPTGLFIRRCESPSLCDFVSLDSRIPSGIHPLPFTFNFRLNSHFRFCILEFCNGLLLCKGVNKNNRILEDRRGRYWNRAIHWLDDAKPPVNFKLDIKNENPLLSNIQLPAMVDKKNPWECKLLESRGSLLLGVVDYAHSQQLNIYEMFNGLLNGP